MAIKYLILIILTLIHMPPIMPMDSKHQPKALENGNNIVFDFLNNHKKFQKNWGTSRQGATYSRLPKDLIKKMSRLIIAPIMPFLKLHIPIDWLVLSGHIGPISKATFDDTGTFLITASADGTAKIWDVKSGICLFSLKGHDDTVNDAQFNKDTTLIATASDDNLAKIWDLKTAKCIQSLSHKRGVTSATFNPAGTLLATTVQYGSARIWDCRTGDCIRKIRDHRSHNKTIESLQFDPSGMLFATGSKVITLWSVDTGQITLELEGSPVGLDIDCLQFNADGTQLLAAGLGPEAEIWNIHTGECVQTLSSPCSNLWIQNAQFNQQNNLVVGGFSDNTVKLWDSQTSHCIGSLDHDDTYMKSPFYDPFSRPVITQEIYDSSPKIYNMVEKKWECKGPDPITCYGAFNPQGDLLATASDDRTAKIWNLKKYFDMLHFLNNELSFEQALLLNCIYQAASANKLLEKKSQKSDYKLDFNTFPALQDYFESLPQAIQEGLQKYVIFKEDKEKCHIQSGLCISDKVITLNLN